MCLGYDFLISYFFHHPLVYTRTLCRFLLIIERRTFLVLSAPPTFWVRKFYLLLRLFVYWVPIANFFHTYNDGCAIISIPFLKAGGFPSRAPFGAFLPLYFFAR